MHIRSIDPILFSILTVTYNRCHTLSRLWLSLNRMKSRDFEWVIIDNGSNDATRSQILSWKSISPFEIIYYCLPVNEGKSKGLNAAKKLISGKYVISVDDDDALFDNALTLANEYILQTKFDTKHDVGNLNFRCVTERGELSGELNVYGPVIESTSLEMKYVHTKRRGGERCSVTKVEVFREFEHIELPPPNDDLLDVISQRRARKYKTIYIDIPIKYFFRYDGLDRMTQRPRLYVSTSIGAYYNNFFRLNEQIDYFFYAPKYFIRSARNMCRAGIHNRKFYLHQSREISSRYGKLLWLLFGVVPGTIKFVLDILRIRLNLTPASESTHYRGY